MKIAMLITALVALLGSFLLVESTQSVHELMQMVEVMKNQIHNQENMLEETKNQLKSVNEELARLKEEQTTAKQNVATEAKEVVRQDRERQDSIRKESIRLLKLDAKLKADGERIQKTQHKLDLAKKQLDASDKLLDVEILTSVVETSVQKTLNSKTRNEPVMIHSKAADRYGETPFDPNTESTNSSAPDNRKTLEALSKKSALAEEHKKLSAQQRMLGEEKQNLTKNLILLKQQQKANLLDIQSSLNKSS